MSISPCQYPDCKQDMGNPALTQNMFCDQCTHWFKRTLQWVLEDYTTLKTTLPRPFTTTTAARGGTKTGYGHPREWASNLAQNIALWAGEVTNNYLQDFGYLPYDLSTEQAAIRKAAESWPQWWDELAARWDGAGEFAEEARDYHRQARAGLGHTRMVTSLSAPCPRCDLKALVVVQGTDTVSCEYCGWAGTEEDRQGVAVQALANAQRQQEHTIDQLIEGYEHG